MAEFGPPPQITKDDLLDVLRRNFEAHWIEGLLTDPSSLSNFEGIIADLLRAQDALDENLYRGAFILTAPGRERATSTLRLTRPSGAAGTIEATTRFLDNRGAIWKPTEDFAVALSGGPQTVDVPIETDRFGYYLNSFEVLTYRIIDELFDPNLVVAVGPDVAADGTTAFLDQHGKERRTFRAPGETDQQYRNRIRFLEDQVSPVALANTVASVLDAFDVTRSIADLINKHGLRALVEPFTDGAQIARAGLLGTDPTFLDDADPGLGTFLDDLGGASVLRSREDACAWFDVFLPTPADPNEAQRFLDDADGDFGSFADDVFLDAPSTGAIAEAIAALADELDRRRAACVRFRIFLGEDLNLVANGDVEVQAGDWTPDGNDAPATNLEALLSFDGDDSYAVTALGTGGGATIAAGDLAVSRPAVPTPVSVERVILRARVRRNDVAAGVDPIAAFLVRPPTAGSTPRILPGVTLSDDAWREMVVVLEENPVTAAPWVVADVDSGAFQFGLANVAAAGATEELRASELTLDLVLNYG